MSVTEILKMLPGPPAVSGLIAIVIAVVLLYLARSPAHKAIFSIFRVLHGGFRLAARSVMLAEERLAKRNKEVLLSAGAEAVERVIEREFQRVDAVVGHWPSSLLTSTRTTGKAPRSPSPRPIGSRQWTRWQSFPQRGTAGWPISWVMSTRRR
jgi:hypothetical protein